MNELVGTSLGDLQILEEYLDTSGKYKYKKVKVKCICGLEEVRDLKSLYNCKHKCCRTCCLHRQNKKKISNTTVQMSSDRELNESNLDLKYGIANMRNQLYSIKESKAKKPEMLLLQQHLELFLAKFDGHDV